MEKILQDEDINIKYMPDGVERKLYNNILTLLVGLLDRLFKSVSFQMIGHRLRVTMIPEQLKAKEESDD